MQVILQEGDAAALCSVAFLSYSGFDEKTLTKYHQETLNNVGNLTVATSANVVGHFYICHAFKRSTKKNLFITKRLFCAFLRDDYGLA